MVKLFVLFLLFATVCCYKTTSKTGRITLRGYGLIEIYNSKGELIDVLFKKRPPPPPPRGSFALHQTLESGSYSEVETFLIGSTRFITAAKKYDNGNYILNSQIYKLDSNIQLIHHQNIETKGAVMIHHFTTSDNENYLAIANEFDGISDEIRSEILIYNTNTDQFDHHAYLSGKKASCASFTTFTLGETFTFGFSGTGASGYPDGKVYKYNPGNNNFQLFQYYFANVRALKPFRKNNKNYLLTVSSPNNGDYNIQCGLSYYLPGFERTELFYVPGAINVEIFTLSGRSIPYFAISCFFDGTSYCFNSRIINSNTKSIVQEIPTCGATDMDYFVHGGTDYLVVTNHGNNGVEGYLEIFEYTDQFISLYKFDVEKPKQTSVFIENNIVYAAIASEVSDKSGIYKINV